MPWGNGRRMMRHICPVCETKQFATMHFGKIKITIDGGTIHERYPYFRCTICKGEWVSMLDNEEDFLERVYKKVTGAKEVIFIFEN